MADKDFTQRKGKDAAKPSQMGRQPGGQNRERDDVESGRPVQLGAEQRGGNSQHGQPSKGDSQHGTEKPAPGGQHDDSGSHSQGGTKQ